MENLRVAADAAFRAEVIGHVDGLDLKTAFEQRYGRRGWQRKLGAVLEVPETTVNGWFKSNKFPALAKLAFGVLLSQTVRPSQQWIPVENGTGYAVCDTRGPVGRIVADNISRLDDAMLLAAAPEVHEAASDAFVVFDDSRDSVEGWDDLADRLGAGLDVSRLALPAGEEEEEERDMKQTVEKFDNSDRKRVIDAIQDHFDVQLTKVQNRNKWLQDETGRNWWVLGGKGDWHGIPEDMMDHEEQAENEGMFVIAQKQSTRIEMFAGPLTPFTDARNNLSPVKQQDGSYQYQFTVKTRGNQLRCDRVPSAALQEFAAFPYSSEAKEKDAKIEEVKKLWLGASAEERKEIVRILKAQPSAE